MKLTELFKPVKSMDPEETKACMQQKEEAQIYSNSNALKSGHAWR